MVTLEDCKNHLLSGGYIQVTTYTKSWLYNKKHVDLFVNDGRGDLCVMHGKRKDCIKYCDIRFLRERIIS